MIDQTVFKAEWAILCDRFNREMSVPVTTRYYQALTDRMDTRTFRDACALVFASNEFFPTPEQFIQAVQPEVESLNQWELCQRVMEGDSVLDRMDRYGQRVVALLGGPAKLRDTQVENVPHVRRDFLAFYQDVSDGKASADRLPEVTPESRRIVGEIMNVLPPKGAA